MSVQESTRLTRPCSEVDAMVRFESVFQATGLGAKCCEKVCASCGSNVVSSRGCDVVKKRSPTTASKHVVTRHGHKEDANKMQRNFITTEKSMDCFSFLLALLFALRKRSPFGNLFFRSVTSFPPPSFLHTTQNAVRGPLYYHKVNFFVTCFQVLCNKSPVALTSLSRLVRKECHHF